MAAAKACGESISVLWYFAASCSPGLLTDCRYGTSLPQTAAAASVVPPEQEKYVASISAPS